MTVSICGIYFCFGFFFRKEGKNFPRGRVSFLPSRTVVEFGMRSAVQIFFKGKAAINYYIFCGNKRYIVFVLQPHVPVRLPCYDFVPIGDPTDVGSDLIALKKSG